MKNKKQEKWNSYEEDVLIRNAGIKSVKELSRVIGRSPSAIRYHANKLRSENRLNKGLRKYTSRTELCYECFKPRKAPVDDICRVCKAKERLARNEDAMYKAYRELDSEYKTKTRRINKSFGVSHRDYIELPKKPNTEGLTDYMKKKLEDDYWIEVEEIEYQQIMMKINATKQRVHQWNKHTKQTNV